MSHLKENHQNSTRSMIVYMMVKVVFEVIGDLIIFFRTRLPDYSCRIIFSTKE